MYCSHLNEWKSLTICKKCLTFVVAYDANEGIEEV